MPVLIFVLIAEYDGFQDTTPNEAVNVRSQHIMIVLQDASGVQVRKKLPASTTVSSLKALAKKMFKLDPLNDITLIWTNEKQDNFELDLTEESQSLHNYSIEDEDVILVKS